MKTKILCYVTISVLISSLFFMIGICVGKSLQPVIIQTGETYQYYDQEFDDQVDELVTWDI